MTNYTCGYCIKRKKMPGILYNINAVSRRAPQLNHWQVTLLFRFNYSHVLPVNHCHIQRIVRVTSPQSMNVQGVVQKLWTISVTQGQQY